MQPRRWRVGHSRVVVLAAYNIKGGVGKTSAAVNLAYLAARDGARTLLWDLDPQGASTYLLRVKPRVKGGGRALVRGETNPDRRIKGTDYDRLDLLPADFSYRHMDLHLDATKRPTRRLARVLDPLKPEYDYVFLDCPPSISLVSESVFEATDALLVPIIPATLSSRTFEQLEDLLDGRRAPVPAGAPMILAFFSMVDRRKRLHREVMDRLRAEWAGVLEAAIPASAEIERMGLERDAVVRYAPGGKAALAYRALWTDVCERLGEYPSPSR
jgi:chromosome partitioning protein